MAEGSNTDDTWWGWLQNAKDKVIAQSSEVLEFVKNDIDEFAKVVTDEASAVVSNTASVLKTKLQLDDSDSAANNVKKSVSGFLSHVAEVFTPPPDDEDEEAFVISNHEPVLLSRVEMGVYTKVQEEDTFLQEPKDEADYNAWLESFDMENKQVEIADLLVTCKPLHKQFSALVPAQVSHTVFWHRYFYLVHCTEQTEERRKQLKNRVNQTSAAIEQTDMLWEDGDSNEDEWEKVEETTSDSTSGAAAAAGGHSATAADSTADDSKPAAKQTAADKPKGEEWETWE